MGLVAANAKTWECNLMDTPVATGRPACFVGLSILRGVCGRGVAKLETPPLRGVEANATGVCLPIREARICALQLYRANIHAATNV